VKFGAGRILDGINIENFGFSAPIGFGNGQIRALKHSEGAPSSCNKVYGEAERCENIVTFGEEAHPLVSNIHRSNLNSSSLGHGSGEFNSGDVGKDSASLSSLARNLDSGVRHASDSDPTLRATATFDFVDGVLGLDVMFAFSGVTRNFD
jgi:hypothetical protein